MKNIFSILFLSIISMSLFAQNFTVQVSSDSVLYGNYFEVKFILEDASGGNFNAPLFENFYIISGPNTSTSMSFMNGEMSQSVSYTYYLEPKEIGNYYIQPASIETSETVLETIPLEVMVVPNPDGIKQNRQRQQRSNSFFDGFFDTPPSFEGNPDEMQDFWKSQPFFNFDDTDWDKLLKEMPEFKFEFPNPSPPMPDQFVPKKEREQEEEAPKKRKRKTTKI